MAPVATLSRAALPRIFRDLPVEPWAVVRRTLVPALDKLCANVSAELPWLEELLARVDPTLSLSRVRARVIQVHAETHDTKTFVLRPNARFGAFRAGAHVLVSARVEGKTVSRAYSLSSAPDESGTVAITVKRVPGGVLSNFLADTLRAGDVLELSVP